MVVADIVKVNIVAVLADIAMTVSSVGVAVDWSFIWEKGLLLDCFELYFFGASKVIHGGNSVLYRGRIALHTCLPILLSLWLLHIACIGLLVDLKRSFGLTYRMTKHVVTNNIFVFWVVSDKTKT